MSGEWVLKCYICTCYSSVLAVMFHIVDDASPPLPDNCSEALKDFFSLCFDKDPTQRPSAELLFEHRWLKSNWGENKVSFHISSILSIYERGWFPGASSPGQYPVSTPGQR